MRTDRIELAYNLTFVTPFHCGTGLSSGLIDRTVVRDAQGYLYVPGSTIKGVVREYCERLARLYAKDSERISSPHDTKKSLWDMGENITMVTRIFGSQQYPGLLSFDDARQSNEEKGLYDSKNGEKVEWGKYRAIQTDLYTQVRIDRNTRTSVPGALYTSEFSLKSLSLQGNITGWLACTAIEGIDNGPTYSLLLLLAGLHMVERLGGNKSTGKGQCRCDISHLSINKTVYTSEQWQPWFDRLDALTSYPMGVAQEEEA